MSIKESVFWLWRKAFPAARKWKNAPVINIWKPGIAGWVTQPVELRTGDATSLGRTPEEWLLSCPEDRFTELRAEAAGAYSAWGHLKVTSCRNLNKERHARRKHVFYFFSFGVRIKAKCQDKWNMNIYQREKGQDMPAPPPSTQFPKTQCDIVFTMRGSDKVLQLVVFSVRTCTLLQVHLHSTYLIFQI